MVPKSWPLIIFSPASLVAGARQVIEKLSASDPRHILLDFLFFERPSDTRSSGNKAADVSPIGADHLIFVAKDFFQIQTIGLAEGLLQKWSGDLKTDEVVIAIRRIALLSDFENVKAKFCLDVRERVIFIGNEVAVLFSQLGIQNRYRAIGSEAMPVGVR